MTDTRGRRVLVPTSTATTQAARARTKRGAVLAAVAAVVTGGVFSVVPGDPATADAAAHVAAGEDRVLQTISVRLGSDGSLTTVDATTVTASGDGEELDSESTSVSPTDALPQLPVRVLTAYRTSQGSGTDLADLEGYTGRVRIDLTVQNLTVEAQDISYDVDGAGREEPALVGVPLTVAASTALEGVKPGAVITDARGTDVAPAASGVTNGVLSQSSDGATQVQWATILAPPQLSPSATLTLVIDAKDLTPPAFDLSVQPGLVTDPSLGALVERTFNPASSDELVLQQRTIEVIGDVNSVLDRAGRSIAEVRQTLDQSVSTLGNKTVADLNSGIVEVGSSLRGVSTTVQSLGTELDGTLRTTGSSSVGQLADAVAALSEMLGDTKAKPVPAKVEGNGCRTAVRTTGTPTTVYSGLLRVSARLRGYAEGTEACKRELATQIINSVGPANPDLLTCGGRPSVTCSLFESKSTFQRITAQLLADGDAALAALDPEKVQEAITAVANQSAELQTAVTKVGTLQGLLDGGDVDTGTLGNQLTALSNAYNALSTTIGSLHQKAGQRLTAQNAISSQVNDLADRLCDFIGTPDGNGDLPAGTLARADVDDLRAELVDTPCAGSNPGGGPGTSIGAKVEENRVAWQEVFDATDISAADLGVAEALAGLLSDLGLLDDAVGDVNDDIDAILGSIDTGLGELATQMTTVVQAGAIVSQKTQAIQDNQDVVTAAVRDAFEDAAEDANEELVDSVDPQIVRVTQQSTTDLAQLARSFDESTRGLAANADEILKDGATTIDRERTELTTSSRQSGAAITAVIDDGLARVASEVSSSTRDTEAASRLLTADLNRVLLDLGTPRAGGSGLLGTLATNSATAGTADYQVSIASDTATSYANVRSNDIAGLLQRQAQARAALERQAEFGAFGGDLPAGAVHRSIYLFHVGS